MHLTFTDETTSDGVVDRSFTLGDVPGVLWSPEVAIPGAALLLMGHGGGLHRRAPGLVARARATAVRDGFHVAAIDAPGHGDRPRSVEDQRWIDAMLRPRAAGESLAPLNASIAERAVPEWQLVIDVMARQLEPDAIGYSGMTLASAIGIPLAAADDRISAAIFGGVFAYDAILGAARGVTIPVEYLLPWNDAEIDRDSGLAVYDAFASTDKTLHAFSESHFRVPPERIDTRFFVRHLTAGR